jgi:hypothetical protein
MAGTIIVDRIESDASYASSINVAAQVTFSNTVNFGVSSVAPTAGVYSPSTNNLAFTTASTERMRIDSNGNVGIGSTPTAIGSYKVLEVNGTSGAYIALKQGGTEYGNMYNNSTDGTTISASGARNIIFQTNAAERMRIDSSGRVTITSQPYVQLVYTDGTGILRNNLVPWNSNRVNRNSAYNSSTKYFTAPVAGIYFVSWQNYRNAGYTAGTGDVLQILKNGTAYVSSYYTGTVVGTVECAANDTIGFYYNNDGGATYLKECYASIWLLG